MRIIHFSDMHAWKLRIEWSDPWYFKRWLGLVNLTVNRSHKYPPDIAHRVLSHLLEQDADGVICTGDVATTGLKAEFAEAAQRIHPIRDKWKDRFVLVPGNHDRYTTRCIHMRQFEQSITNPAPCKTLGTLAKAYAYGPFTLITYECNEARYIRSNATFTENMAEELSAFIGAFTDKPVLLAGHYPVILPPHVHESWQHKLIGSHSLRDVLKRHRIPIYLQGHKHVRWQLESDLTPDTIHVNSGSCGLRSSTLRRKPGYIIIELDDRTATVNAVVAVEMDPETQTFSEYKLPRCQGIPIP